jgi:hypothetical protein
MKVAGLREQLVGVVMGSIALDSEQKDDGAHGSHSTSDEAGVDAEGETEAGVAKKLVAMTPKERAAHDLARARGGGFAPTMGKMGAGGGIGGMMEAMGPTKVQAELGATDQGLVAVVHKGLAEDTLNRAVEVHVRASASTSARGSNSGVSSAEADGSNAVRWSKHHPTTPEGKLHKLGQPTVASFRVPASLPGVYVVLPNATAAALAKSSGRDKKSLKLKAAVQKLPGTNIEVLQDGQPWYEGNSSSVVLGVAAWVAEATWHDDSSVVVRSPTYNVQLYREVKHGAEEGEEATMSPIVLPPPLMQLRSDSPMVITSSIECNKKLECWRWSDGAWTNEGVAYTCSPTGKARCETLHLGVDVVLGEDSTQAIFAVQQRRLQKQSDTTGIEVGAGAEEPLVVKGEYAYNGDPDGPLARSRRKLATFPTNVIASAEDVYNSLTTYDCAEVRLLNIVGGTCPTGCNGHGECCGMCEIYS